MNPNYKKLNLGRELTIQGGDVNNHGDCFNYGIVAGCDIYCPVLQRGECELKNEENEDLYNEYLETFCTPITFCEAHDILLTEQKAVIIFCTYKIDIASKPVKGTFYSFDIYNPENLIAAYTEYVLLVEYLIKFKIYKQ